MVIIVTISHETGNTAPQTIPQMYYAFYSMTLNIARVPLANFGSQASCDGVEIRKEHRNMLKTYFKNVSLIERVETDEIA